MKILSIIGGTSGEAVFNYRVKGPLLNLTANTDHEVKWVHFDKLDTITEIPDIIVLNRPVGDDSQRDWIRDDFIGEMKEMKATVVLETDDDYVTAPQDGKTSLPYLDYVDAVIVATDGLKRLYSEYTDKRIYVVKNSVSADWFARKSLDAGRDDDRLTMGLIGTNGHITDWRIFPGVIQAVRDKYPDVRFTCTGLHPDYLEDIAEFVEGKPYPEYPGLMRQIDILCCPLHPDKVFNESKSAVKAMEGWASARKVNHKLGGCAVIAAKSAAYNGTVQHNHNGLLVEHDERSWTDAISQMIEDEFQRLKFQVEGYRDVKKYHDITNNWRHWAKTYESIRRTYIEGGTT